MPKVTPQSPSLFQYLVPGPLPELALFVHGFPSLPPGRKLPGVRDSPVREDRWHTALSGMGPFPWCNSVRWQVYPTDFGRKDSLWESPIEGQPRGVHLALKSLKSLSSPSSNGLPWQARAPKRPRRGHDLCFCSLCSPPYRTVSRGVRNATDTGQKQMKPVPLMTSKQTLEFNERDKRKG